MISCFQKQNKTDKSHAALGNTTLSRLILLPLIGILAAPSLFAADTPEAYPEADKQIVGDAKSTSEDRQTVWVLGPLIDVYEGPAISYSIIHTLEKGEQLELHKRFTQWIEVTSQSGIKGWISADDAARLADANGRPLTSRAPIRDKAGRFSIKAAAGTLDGSSHGELGLGYGLSENLRVEGILGHTTEGLLQGRHLQTALLLDFKPFSIKSFETTPYASIGYGIFYADGQIDGIKSFDAFQSTIGLKHQLYGEVEGFIEYKKDIILISGPRNIHADGFQIGIMTYF